MREPAGIGRRHFILESYGAKHPLVWLSTHTRRVSFDPRTIQTSRARALDRDLETKWSIVARTDSNSGKKKARGGERRRNL